MLEESKILISPFEVTQKQKTPPSIHKKKVIVIAGPTGVGKTEISLRIAKVSGGEVISSDSMQVYRGMDIGTAKVTEEEKLQVPHHLIDIRDLSQSFNVKDFYDEAMVALRSIHMRGHVPIVVGGTGFYVHALIYGPPAGPASMPEVRARIEQEMDEKGTLHLFDRLKELDPEYASSITHRDRHKIIRALEIITITNEKVSKLERGASGSHENYDFRCWFLYKPKELLYERVDRRCEEMIAMGFVEEVRKLEREGLRNNSSASQAIGYRQCLEFLASPQTKEDMDHFVDAFKRASRRYVKRQFTWFKREPLFRWLDIDATSKEHAIELILQDYETS
ncbi:MAG: tRNA (adenosine(37)-N6)-dimethylallyltransferase MiaA [Chlamydiales bacterium]|nr:tRNA (adenosine(37)-N6)-dimethylallyltransferase MiaA [Chlamydiales bacterium]